MPQTALGKLMPLALAYLRYNLKQASRLNLASMLLLVVTLTLGSMQISICINRGFKLVSVYINTYIILIPYEHCNEHCKLTSKESAF